MYKIYKIYKMKQFLNKHISDIEPIFKKHNQPTRIYTLPSNNIKGTLPSNNIKGTKGKLLGNFGSNEGGPSYEIYIDQTGIISEIKEFDMNFDTSSIDVTTYSIK
jgi:hypothetical protein